MKKHTRWIAAVLAVVMAATLPATSVSATNLNNVRSKRQQSEQKLNDAQDKINDLKESQSAVQSELDALEADLVDIVTSLSSIERDIANTQKNLEETQSRYEQAKEEETQQYEDMKKRIKYLYESGDAGYLAAFLKVESFADMLNKAEYAQSIYDIDRELLKEYQDTKEEVASTYQAIQDKKADLEDVKAERDDQKAFLQTAIDKKSAESAAFANEIAAAQQEAEQYADEIANARNEEEELKARERQRLAVAKTLGVNSSSSVSIGSNSGSSGKQPTGKSSDATLGQQIVDYACQFIGNPYVYGGNSLTGGIDCSGFTQQVFAHFGISLPRTAMAQRGSGYAVESLSQARAGDLIFYDDPSHVAIYRGDGTIVHASNSKKYPAGGIKTSNAEYRKIKCIRRCY